MTDINKINDISTSNITTIYDIPTTSIASIVGLSWPGGGSGGGDFYSHMIDYSCRFNDDDSAYLIKSFSAASSGGTKKTISCWIKRSNLTANCVNAYPNIWSFHDASGYSMLRFFGNDKVCVTWWDGTSNNNTSTYSPILRDTSAWYNLVTVIDTTEATNTNRIKLYINGVQYATSGACPTQDSTVNIMENGVDGAIAYDIQNSGRYFDGYVAEVHAIDGQALEPTDFGQFQNGIWTPKEYTGTYGNNGFYLDFSNSSDLGEDSSGNSNDFTPTNLTSTDQVTDTPTNNWCVISPLEYRLSATNIYTEGNLTYSNTSGGTDGMCRATFGLSSGTWYWEVKCVAEGSSTAIGVMSRAVNINVGSGHRNANMYSYIANDGNFWNGSSSVSYGDTYTTNDIIGVALDMGTGKIWFSKNGTWQNSGDPVAGTNEAGTINDIELALAAFGYNTSTFAFNCGQDSANVSSGNADGNGYGDFEYAPPTGFLALCSANLSDPAWMSDPITDTPKNAFDIVLREGTGAEVTVSGLSFQPDLVAIKNRDQTDSWAWVDSVRGATHAVASDSSTEGTDANGLTSFDANGYTIGTGAGGYNDNAESFVDYSWLESPTYGVDIVEYTGNGTNQAIAHSLGIVPQFIITHEQGSANGGWTYHEGVASDPETDYLRFSGTAGATDHIDFWNDTAPTTTHFTVGAYSGVNTNLSTYIAWLFASIEGFSKFGYYIGNGNANGPFVYCGFKPKMVLVKNIVLGSSNWLVWDTTRSTYNLVDKVIKPNLTGAEATDYGIDIVSNGFKIKTAQTHDNGSGERHIFMAFAEFPFKYSTGV